MQTMVAVQTDITPKASIANPASNQAESSTESFSSTLDKQLEQTNPQKPAKPSSALKEEKSVQDSGKELPSKTAKTEEASTEKLSDEETVSESEAQKQASAEEKSSTETNPHSTEENNETSVASHQAPVVNTQSDKVVKQTELSSEENTQKAVIASEVKADSKPLNVSSQAKNEEMTVQTNDTKERAPLEQTKNTLTVSQSQKVLNDNQAQADQVSEKSVVNKSPELKAQAKEVQEHVKSVQAAIPTVDEKVNKVSASEQTTLAEKLKNSQPKTDNAVISQLTKVEVVEKESSKIALAPVNKEVLEVVKSQIKPVTEVKKSLKTVMAEQILDTTKLDTQTSKETLTNLLQARVDKPGMASPLPIAQQLSTSSGLTTSASNHSAQSTQLTSLDIQPSLRSEAWSKVMSGRVVWMAKQGIQQAELKLNPASLGPVEVRLHVQNEQVNVTFIAQNATTRETLEQALPRLREGFAESGIALADTEVRGGMGQDAGGQQGQDDASGPIFSQVTPDDDDIKTEETTLGENAKILTSLSLYA